VASQQTSNSALLLLLVTPPPLLLVLLLLMVTQPQLLPQLLPHQYLGCAGPSWGCCC
jgi:hypothetical protein